MNLPVVLFFCLFSALCLVASSSLFIVLSCLLPCCVVLKSLFACFHRNQFCSPTINKTFCSQSKGWFSFILLCRLEKYYWTGPLGLCWYKLYQQDFRAIPTYIFIEKLSPCDKLIKFHSFLQGWNPLPFF